jgi:ABC-type glycerol-3-phosphate transport system permease component
MARTPRQAPKAGSINASVSAAPGQANQWRDRTRPLTGSRASGGAPSSHAVAASPQLAQDDLVAAGSIIVVLPPLVLFAALNRFCVRGMFAGSVK